MTSTANLTVSPVDSVPDGDVQLRGIQQSIRTAEDCQVRAYELVLAATSRVDAGDAGMITCLVLDLGDLSVRAVELMRP
jgi:hypothetical protein